MAKKTGSLRRRTYRVPPAGWFTLHRDDGGQRVDVRADAISEISVDDGNHAVVLGYSMRETRDEVFDLIEAAKPKMIPGKLLTSRPDPRILAATDRINRIIAQAAERTRESTVSLRAIRRQAAKNERQLVALRRKMAKRRGEDQPGNS